MTSGSTSTSSGPVEPFATQIQEAFHQYLQQTSSNRSRFDDTKYDKYKIWLLNPEMKERDPKEQKKKKRVLKKYYLNGSRNELYYRDGSGCELKVLRDWQLFGVISNAHSSVQHAGQEKTFDLLNEQYHGIQRKEVRWLLKHCKICGLNRPSKKRAPLQPIIVTRLFERVQVDLIDMRHEPDGTNKWICHIKDHFSKYCYLAALEDKTAESVADVLSMWIHLYGPPDIFQFDNGREFKGAVLQLIRDFAIKVKNGKPRTPQVQGLVEQANAVVQSRLTKWKAESGLTCWSRVLPNIASGINRTKHSATLKTPYEIVFGRPYRQSAHIAISEAIEATEADVQDEDNSDNTLSSVDSDAEADFIATFSQSVRNQIAEGSRLRQKVDEAVLRRGELVREKMASRYNKRHETIIFNIGDLVSIKVPREDRAKTDHKRLYCKIIAKPHSERHQLLCKYGVLAVLYPTKDLQPASDLMGLEDDILDTPELRKTKITLASAARQASITTRVSISCTCKGACSTRRCRCFKQGISCSSHCHKQAGACQNQSELSESEASESGGPESEGPESEGPESEGPESEVPESEASELESDASEAPESVEASE